MLYTLISLIILALGSIPLLSAINRNGRENNEDNRRRVRRGAMISAITVAFLILLHLFFYYFTEFLWFEAVKYTARFWTIFITKILLFVCGFVFASLFLIWNVHISLRRYRQLLTMRNFFNIAILIGLAMGIYAVPEWNKLLLFLGRGASPIREPVFNMTTGFYLFSLPFYSYWINWLIILIVLSMAMIVTIGSVTAAERFAGEDS